MASDFFDNPGFIHTVLEELPVGIYIVDRERRIRFWNHGAAQITGRLSHEAVGRFCTGQIVEACDGNGHIVGDHNCPVTATLRDAQPRKLAAHLLHKEGHMVPVKIRCRAIIRNGNVIEGAIVVFEEAAEPCEELIDPLMYGCLDTVTGIPTHRLTRAVLAESMAAMEETGHGFGLVRIRVLGLDEFRTKHGPQSVVPFLRTTAHTLRHNLDPASFLGRWGEDEFIAVLPSANPVASERTAETVWSLVTRSEVCWWGDRFPVEAIVTHTMAQPGDRLEKLLNGLEPPHAAAAGRAIGVVRSGTHAGPLRG